MTTYTNITNALVAVGAKPFATTIQALRDNPIAIAEGEITAPIVMAGWHPYNKTMNNGSETGAIWTFDTNGAVAAVTTPDFVDNWEYMLVFDQIRTSTAGSGIFLQLNLFRETGGAYAGVMNTSVDFNASLGSIPFGYGFAEIREARNSRRGHMINVAMTKTTTGGGASITNGLSTTLGVAHSQRDKILRAQVTFSSGNITGVSDSAIYLYRRRLL